jgi:hypothetical protein
VLRRACTAPPSAASKAVTTTSFISSTVGAWAGAASGATAAGAGLGVEGEGGAAGVCVAAQAVTSEARVNAKRVRMRATLARASSRGHRVAPILRDAEGRCDAYLRKRARCCATHGARRDPDSPAEASRVPVARSIREAAMATATATACSFPSFTRG